MNPISIIIIYTLFIIPYSSVYKESVNILSEIKETYNFFKEQYKNSKTIGKFLYFVLIVFIFILLLILAPIFILTLLCSHTLKTNLKNIHANIYKYFFMPYIFTSILVSKITHYKNYGPSLTIIKEYYIQLNNLFTEKSVVHILILILILGGVLNLAPRYFFSEENYIEKNFWDLMKLLFNSSMLTLFFLIFLGVFFILTDNVTSTLTPQLKISFFDVYSTLSLYYASCILLVKIVFNLSIKPFIESRKKNDNLLQSH